MRKLRLPIAVAALLLFACVPAGAVIDQEGDLIATFDGGINPTALPRATPAPVSVHVAGNFRSASGDTDHLAQLRSIVVRINSRGRLFDRGLPTCDVRAIQPSSPPEAKEICGDALVGSGHVVVQVRIPSQAPFLVRARILAFNGPRKDGKKLILAQAYARTPPNSFILTFRVDRRDGEFGTVLSTTLPVEAQKWAYLTHFDMTLHRTYTYRGIRRSFVSAACTAPPGFGKAPFTFAKTSYRFDNGSHLRLTQTDVCRVARR